MPSITEASCCRELAAIDLQVPPRPVASASSLYRGAMRRREGGCTGGQASFLIQQTHNAPSLNSHLFRPEDDGAETAARWFRHMDVERT